MEITSLWTSEINGALELEIMSCFEDTFATSKSGNYFKWKFRDNPFGESLHILVTNRGKVIGTRVFWRLDIGGVEAYQCVDTAVLPEFQGIGLFKRTTLEALGILSGKFIYNYPNKLSGPAYISSGWKVVKDSTSIKVNLTNLMLERAPGVGWNGAALRWRFEKSPEAVYYAVKKDNFQYLFSEKRKNLFSLLCRTDFELDLKNINPLICFSYDNCSRGLPFFPKLPYMSKGAGKHKLHTYLFDMA